MCADIQDPTFQLLTARRLIALANRNAEVLAARKAGKFIKPRSIKETFAAADQASISEAARAGCAASRPSGDIQIRLGDLIKQLERLRSGGANDEPASDPNACQDSAGQNTHLAFEHTVTEITMEFRSYQPVEGLVRRSQTLAESNRYTFEFSDGVTFKITDKWSGRSTTIWGDPHVDTSDQEGKYNGEFSDLTASSTHTTLLLEDGTRLTFTAQDRGVIERVDLFQGQQHLCGLGSAAAGYTPETGQFANPVSQDGDSAASATPLGDTVRAGGDGNDWFDSAGRLVWGQTTGLTPLSQPLASVQLTVSQRTERLAISSLYRQS